jgi:Bacterial regulatory proteins, luxR family
VALLAGGATDAQIAGRLFLSVNTVRSYLDRIRDKTGARRRAKLVRYAIQAGIEASPLPPEDGLPARRDPPPDSEWAVRPTPGALDGAARPLPSDSGRAHTGFTAPPPRRNNPLTVTAF